MKIKVDKEVSSIGSILIAFTLIECVGIFFKITFYPRPHLLMCAILTAKCYVLLLFLWVQIYTLSSFLENSVYFIKSLINLRILFL